jgi:hypothetical protein
MLSLFFISTIKYDKNVKYCPNKGNSSLYVENCKLGGGVIMAKQIVKMKVIQKPVDGTASVFMNSTLVDFSPYVAGEGNIDYVCGNCNHVLQKSVNVGQLNNVVLFCPPCGSYNV